MKVARHAADDHSKKIMPVWLSHINHETSHDQRARPFRVNLTNFGLFDQSTMALIRKFKEGQIEAQV